MALTLEEIPQTYQERTERFITARSARLAAHADEAAKQQAYFDAQDVSRKADDEFNSSKAAMLSIIEEASALDEDKADDKEEKPDVIQMGGTVAGQVQAADATVDKAAAVDAALADGAAGQVQ